MRSRDEDQTSTTVARLDSKTTPLLAFGGVPVTFYQASRSHLGTEATTWGSAFCGRWPPGHARGDVPALLRYAPDLTPFVTDAGWQPSGLNFPSPPSRVAAANVCHRRGDRFIQMTAVTMFFIFVLGPTHESSAPSGLGVRSWSPR